MNPSSSERAAPNLPLPPKAPEQLPPEFTPKANPNKDAAVAETAPAAPEQNVIGVPPATALPPLPLPLPPSPQTAGTQTQAQSDDDVSSTTQAAVPDIADDRDLIEKEWIHKAKQIVEQTREDPYQQSREMTVFKADYMKKRYNKIIKIE